MSARAVMLPPAPAAWVQLYRRAMRAAARIVSRLSGRTSRRWIGAR